MIRLYAVASVVVIVDNNDDHGDDDDTVVVAVIILAVDMFKDGQLNNNAIRLQPMNITSVIQNTHTFC